MCQPLTWNYGIWPDDKWTKPECIRMRASTHSLPWALRPTSEMVCGVRVGCVATTECAWGGRTHKDQQYESGAFDTATQQTLMANYYSKKSFSALKRRRRGARSYRDRAATAHCRGKKSGKCIDGSLRHPRAGPGSGVLTS